MKRYVLTPSAKRNVNDIWNYIAKDNIEAADRVLDALESAIVKLAKNPGVGHLGIGQLWTRTCAVCKSPNAEKPSATRTASKLLKSLVRMRGLEPPLPCEN